jgi:hypothetical protein
MSPVQGSFAMPGRHTHTVVLFAATTVLAPAATGVVLDVAELVDGGAADFDVLEHADTSRTQTTSVTAPSAERVRVRMRAP